MDGRTFAPSLSKRHNRSANHCAYNRRRTEQQHTVGFSLHSLRGGARDSPPDVVPVVPLDAHAPPHALHAEDVREGDVVQVGGAGRVQGHAHQVAVGVPTVGEGPGGEVVVGVAVGVEEAGPVGTALGER